MPKYAVVERSVTTSLWGHPRCFDWATEALRHVHKLLAGTEPDLVICDLEAKEELNVKDLQAQAAEEEAFKPPVLV